MPKAEILAKFEACGIFPTPQRLEVARLLLCRPQHLSADQIIDSLRESGSTVSKATVYNTLNLFQKKGLVRECLVDAERRIYDSTTTPHHHFYNEDTGELTDITSDDVDVAGLPELPAGTRLECAELIVRVRNVK